MSILNDRTRLQPMIDAVRRSLYPKIKDRSPTAIAKAKEQLKVGMNPPSVLNIKLSQTAIAIHSKSATPHEAKINR